MAEDQNKEKDNTQQNQQDQQQQPDKPRNQEPATAIKPASTEPTPATGSAKNSK